MQTLGLSDSTPRTESRWRALFWPTIRNEGDLDYVTRQGFWICMIVAGMGLLTVPLSGSPWLSLHECLFYFLAAIGVRERDRASAACAFLVYLISTVILMRYPGFSITGGASIIRFIFLALLFANIRGNWQALQWSKETLAGINAMRLNQTFMDKFADRMPAAAWPAVRYIFYVVATVELGLLLLAMIGLLFAPKQ